MTLRYQTGVATLTQLIVMLLLNFVNGVVSTAQACTNGGGCVSNIVTTALFIIALAIWLMFISMVGYAAQDKRSRPMARLLIVAESLVAIVAFFDARHFPNVLGLITSIIDFALAVWVITLAYRLSKARGGRISAKPRARTRAKASR